MSYEERRAEFKARIVAGERSRRASGCPMSTGRPP